MEYLRREDRGGRIKRERERDLRARERCISAFLLLATEREHSMINNGEREREVFSFPGKRAGEGERPLNDGRPSVTGQSKIKRGGLTTRGQVGGLARRLVGEESVLKLTLLSLSLCMGPLSFSIKEFLELLLGLLHSFSIILANWLQP